MKHTKYFALLILAISLCKCIPDYEVQFPNEIPYGTILVYIDGEKTDFTNISFYFKKNDSLELLRISLEQSLNSEEFYNQITCSTFYPEENAEYSISGETIKSPNNVGVFFSQTYDEDLEGWEYEYCASKDDYFKIEKIDLINQVISARGKLRFKRIKKHGAPSGAGIDKIIYIEFAFHDFLEIK